MSVFHLARWHLMSEVSQDWQMYILFELLSDFKGTHTHMHGHYPPAPLTFSFFLLFCFRGVLMSFSVIPPLNANTRAHAYELRHLLS